MSSALELQPPNPRGVPPLLARLIDAADVFWPHKRPLGQALSGYLAARDEEFGGLVGLFLCPVSRLPELIAELIKAKPSYPVPLSLVADTGLNGLPKAVSTAESRRSLVTLEMVEMPAPADLDEVWLERVAEFVPDEATKAIEPRRHSEHWLDGVRQVVGKGFSPKIRCGGVARDSFPSVDDVANFLAVVTPEKLPFKASTGMHTAIRGTDSETGLTHHGFLNLVVAVARSLSGRDVREALHCTDAELLTGEVEDLSPDASTAVRSVLHSYSAATLAEPSAELHQLGLV